MSNDDIKAIYKKLFLVRAAIHANGKIIGEGHNSFQNYDYIKPHQLLEIVNPLLNKHNLFIAFNITNLVSFNSKVATSTTVINPATKESTTTSRVDESPDYGAIVEVLVRDMETDTQLTMNLYVPIDKFTPQGYGAVLTYAEKYWYFKQFGIATNNDDVDGKDSSKGKEKGNRPTI